MLAILGLGFLIGIRHAVESDHVAAVATLATRVKTVRETVPLGILWGIGHTLTLFAFGSVVLFLDAAVPERLAIYLELAVGVMLIVLGADILYRLVRERIHFHSHTHEDGAVHFHAHSHAGEKQHDPARHFHGHSRALSIRALFVGIMHGMAGSAALMLLTLQSVQSIPLGLAYIAFFGLGSILGMALMSVVIALPLKRAAQSVTWVYNGLKGSVGAATIGLGALMVYQSAGVV